MCVCVCVCVCVCKEVAGVCHSEFAVKRESDLISHDARLSLQCNTHSVCLHPNFSFSLHFFSFFLSFILPSFPSFHPFILSFFLCKSLSSVMDLCDQAVKRNVCVCVCVSSSAEFITPSNRPEGVWSVLLTGVRTLTHTLTNTQTHTHTYSAYWKHSFPRTWRNMLSLHFLTANYI